MKNPAPHNSKEFFIGGKMVLIRPLDTTEEFASNTYTDLLSKKQLTALGELQHIPVKNLSEISNLTDSFVYLAESEENDQSEPLGVALYIKNEVTEAHEMSILIVEKYASTRLPFELADSLIKDASSHRVMTLYTVDRNDDTNMAKLAKKLGMSTRWMPGGNRHTKYSLQVDAHPGVVVF